ncbi:hypothetical protein BDV95DRAFT_611867 [Massariosphaeria phaeospora]|uniref:Uncharacterized protein n=1 Tax=Massariosphaeria phaeospora TaxID=100035 RepID=A0A7C8I2N4_9PLEO|nr:hypothetical protein BDV95DRAFT_611867 [Massariosphaeria phaeospora]
MPQLQLAIVQKPPITYAKRHTNKRLRQRTISNLRQKARHHGLDTRRLTYKWELIHILIENKQGRELAYYDPDINIDGEQTLFLDLPGEIRNLVYEHVAEALDMLETKKHKKLQKLRFMLYSSGQCYNSDINSELWRYRVWKFMTGTLRPHLVNEGTEMLSQELLENGSNGPPTVLDQLNNLNFHFSTWLCPCNGFLIPFILQ